MNGFLALVVLARAETPATDFPDLLRRNPTAAHILIGRLGTEGAPHFYRNLDPERQVFLLAATERTIRFITDFGIRGLDAYREFGEDIAWLHSELGLATLDWPQRVDPLQLAVAARFGTKGVAPILSGLGTKARAAIAVFPPEIAARFRQRRDFVSLVREAAQTDCLDDLAQALSFGGDASFALLSNHIAKPDFQTLCKRLGRLHAEHGPRK